MKTACLFVFFFFSISVFCQNADSLLAVKQVDSLIKVSRDLTSKRDFDKALEMNAAAEKIALEKLGRESAAYGSCCFNHGRVLYFKRDYPEAEKWYLESKDIREKALGKEHTMYAASLNSLAILYREIGRYEKAEPFCLEAKDIVEKALGKEHPNYAGSLNNLANLYYEMGRYEKAELLFLEAKDIREKVLGKEHRDYTASLNNLAELYRVMGRYEKAELLFLEAKGILEKALGKEHPNYVACLNNLAALYNAMGLYEKAEPLYLEAKQIREKTLGKGHPHYAQVLHNLAILYSDMGRYEESEPLYLETKDIWEKTLGKEHTNYAASLNNLAILYKDMGRYEKAEPLYLEAKDIREKTLGKELPDYAQSLNNLANLYYAMGLHEKAELLHLEAKDIREKALGKEHPDYAQSLNNLAILYKAMGRYEESEPLHLEAKQIREKTLGKGHPHYAQSLNNLAGVYFAMGRYENAELLVLEAKDIREKALGKEHPDYAASQISLAILYREMDRYEKAEPLAVEAKDLREKALGREHPDYAQSLKDLAILYHAMDLHEKAEPLLLELSVADRRLMEKAMLHLSEQEMNDYLNTFSERQNFSFAFIQSTGSQRLITTGFDNSLFYKGFLLQAGGWIKQLALKGTAATEKFNKLKGYQRRLAALYAQPIAERDSVLVTQLETLANDLEKDIVRMVAGYAQAKRQVTWQEVQQKLQAGEAAVEFVHYRYYEKKQTDSIIYAALLLRPGDAQPVFVPLFEEKQLDSLLQLKTLRRADYVSDLYAYVERSMSIPGRPKKSLGELLWQPLEKHLLPAEGTKAGGGVKTIYYSPSGLLHRLNLGAVSINPDSVLADRFRLVELGSTRQLVVPTAIKPAANDAVLFGGVRYEADSTAIQQANAGLDSVSIAGGGELSFGYTDSTLRAAHLRAYGGQDAWNYLAGTEKEIAGIGALLLGSGMRSTTFKGYAATEEAFKSIGAAGKPSPRILHVATHGFFFPDPKTDPKRHALSAGEGWGAADPVFKISEHPMIRSGLLLAGANGAWATGKPLKPGLEDGILTAYEISQMNLSNTELVVLSACETGLGDIEGNEGVYGLQRAFKIAGAKYLIMSLWQVQDKQTSLLMTMFYKKWLEEKMAIPEAFRAAQAALRQAGLDPYQWAGFVLVE